MALNKISKKRSFSTFESNQNDIEYSANKKPRNEAKKRNKNKKRRNRDSSNNNFFDIKFLEPDDFDKEQSHCLEFHNLLSFMQEHHLYGLIKNELNEWYQSKFENKNSNQVETNGKFDIHLFHNRHNAGTTGYAYIYFENKSDASYILQQSSQNKLKTKNRIISCAWRENQKDRDSYSSIYLTNATLKGNTNIIKISNLHWKTTLLHLRTLFLSLKDTETDDNDDDDDNKREFDPQWMKIMEDKNGFPKNQALVLLRDVQDVVYCVDKLQKHVLFGRKMQLEYSSYVHEGVSFAKYNEHNLQLSGLSNKLLLSNIKQSVKRSDVVKFLKMNIKDNVDEMIRDVYLMHNLERVCGGKCFLEFNNVDNATLCFDLLQFKQLCNRTVLVEYGHMHDDEDMFSGNKDLRDKTNRLFMSNLAWDVKEKDIKRFFGDKLAIDNVYFNVSINGFPKGSAFIRFEGVDIASKAFDQSNGKKLKNRVIKLDFADHFVEEMNPFLKND